MRNAASKAMWVGRATAMFFVVLTLIVLANATKAYAAPGDLDPSFDADGKVTTSFGSFGLDKVFDSALQPDGKIVVVGKSDGNFALARYNANGTLDTTFARSGRVVTALGSDNDAAAHAVTLQPGGKIVAAGYTTSGTNKDFAVVRYNASGTLDTTFSGDGIATAAPGAEVEDIANDVALQGTKIVVVGSSGEGTTPTGEASRPFGSTRDFAVVRFGSTGTLDTTFGEDGMITTDFFGEEDRANAVVVTGTKIVVAGSAAVPLCGDDPGCVSSLMDFALARYNDNGSLDTNTDADPAVHFDTDGRSTFTSFGDGTSHDTLYGFVIYGDHANDIAIQEDGKLVAAGISKGDFALVRFNPDGSVDEEFDYDGKSTADFGGYFDKANSVAIQDDGRIVAAGTSITSLVQGALPPTAADFALARFNEDGTLNNTFSNDGKLKTNFATGVDEGQAVSIQEDGKLVVAGYADNSPTSGYDFALARYFGTNDTSAPRVSAPVQSLVVPSTLGTSSVPTKLSWSASDTEGEVTRYQVQQSINEGAYTNVSLPTATTTSTTLQLSYAATRPGVPNTYRFRMRATDDNGNRSFWKYGPTFTPSVLQESSSSITYSAGWTPESLGSFHGGGVKYASAAGESAKLTFTGRNVAWVTTVDCSRGVAEVYLDGTKVASKDLCPTNNTTLYKQMMYSANGLNPTVNHTLEIKVVGTTNRPRVDVDAFVVLR